jgi:hypothetical protein
VGLLCYACFFEILYESGDFQLMGMALLVGGIKGLTARKERKPSLFAFENNDKLPAPYDPSEGDTF